MRWKLFKYALVFFSIISIAIAIVTIYSLSKQVNPLTYNWKDIFIALFWQVVTVCIIVFCWKINIKMNIRADLRWKEATAHIGLNSLGKYSPGKVVGSIARGLTIYKHYGNSNGIIFASIVEQVAMIHSGVVLYGLLIMFGKVSHVAYASTWLIIFASLIVIPITLEFCLKLFKRKYRTELQFNRAVDKWQYLKCYICIYIILTAVWCTTSFSLYFVAKGIGVNIGIYICSLATISGYLSGFIALFLPAGIGVREGVIVAYMMKITSAPVATSIALTMRLISIFIDIIIGLVALRQSYGYEKQ